MKVFIITLFVLSCLSVIISATTDTSTKKMDKTTGQPFPKAFMDADSNDIFEEADEEEADPQKENYFHHGGYGGLRFGGPYRHGWRYGYGGPWYGAGYYGYCPYGPYSPYCLGSY